MPEAKIRAIVSAARETTHATANLATVAAQVAETAAAAAHARVAIEGAMEAARAAFLLDDVYRANNGSLVSLDAAAAALASAEGAIRAAREAIENSRKGLVPVVEDPERAPAGRNH